MQFDQPTPAAGWYADPSDPARERWWNGVDWSDTLRPLATAAPPEVAPVFAAPAAPPSFGGDVFAAPAAPATPPSFGGDVFAAPTAPPSFGGDVFAAPAAPAAPPSFGGDVFAAAPTGWGAQAAAPAASPSPASPGSNGDFALGAPEQSPWAAWGPDTNTTAPASAPAWQAPAPTGSNGLAIAGLVLGLLGGGVVGIILSVLGLRKARELEEMGGLPVGRTMARWGLGLSIASLVWTTIVLVFWIGTFTVLASSGAFDEIALEQQLTESVSFPDLTVDSVDCPSDVSYATGSRVSCTVLFTDLTTARIDVTLTGSADGPTIDGISFE